MMGTRDAKGPSAEAVMRDPAATDQARASAVADLSDSFVPGAWAVGKRYLTSPSSSRAMRQAAMRQMAISVRYQFTPEANPTEFVALQGPFLNADDPSFRLAAAREVSCARIPESRAALEARKKIEVDARVLVAIDESLAGLAKPDNIPWSRRPR